MSVLARWMNRIIDADERHICGCCDDRFPGRAEGVAHVIACHPEFAGAVDRDWTPVSEPVPVRPLGTTRPFMPVWG
ncbi:MAG TPA: hypothetical protein VFW55_10290 [Propionicimonas sp.]|nr:hypothetical protein [Propionicimonas sp.]